MISYIKFLTLKILGIKSLEKKRRLSSHTSDWIMWRLLWLILEETQLITSSSSSIRTLSTLERANTPPKVLITEISSTPSLHFFTIILSWLSSLFLEEDGAAKWELWSELQIFLISFNLSLLLSISSMFFRMSFM